eukprot:2300700-Pyramimonas_sp.AAC.1
MVDRPRRRPRARAAAEQARPPPSGRGSEILAPSMGEHLGPWIRGSPSLDWKTSGSTSEARGPSLGD